MREKTERQVSSRITCALQSWLPQRGNAYTKEGYPHLCGERKVPRVKQELNQEESALAKGPEGWECSKARKGILYKKLQRASCGSRKKGDAGSRVRKAGWRADCRGLGLFAHKYVNLFQVGNGEPPEVFKGGNSKIALWFGYSRGRMMGELETVKTRRK